MKHTLILLSTFLLLFASCKKGKVEIPESNDPIFKATGTFGSNSFSLIAGDNEVYMHTMTDVINNVEVVSGKIANNDFGIEIGIFDGFIDQPSHEFTNDFELTPIFASFQSQPIVVLTKNYFSNSNEILQINWTIDNTQYQGVAPIYEPGKYNVCAEIIFLDNTVKNLCNELILGYSIHETATMSYDFDMQFNTFQAYFEPVNSTIQSVQWFIDGVYAGDTDTLYSTNLTGSHKIKGEVLFSNGVKRTKEMYFDSYNETHTIEEFTFFENLVSISNPQDYNISLKVTQNGTVYESSHANNNNSTVQITGVDYYGKNNNGNDVYKINATINCKVKEPGTSNEVPLNFTTVFGLEIK